MTEFALHNYLWELGNERIFIGELRGSEVPRVFVFIRQIELAAVTQKAYNLPSIISLSSSES